VSAQPVIARRSTSKLGHLKSGTALIYKKIGNSSSAISAEEYTGAVYYIKQEADYNGHIYYLISHAPSASTGVIGWVKASDLTVKDHLWAASQAGTYYIKGTGKAYSKAWGGTKDVVYEDMSQY